jgi:hypothetical protein
MADNPAKWLAKLIYGSWGKNLKLVTIKSSDDSVWAECRAISTAKREFPWKLSLQHFY